MMTTHVSSFEIEYHGARPNKRRAVSLPEKENSELLLFIWLDENLTSPPSDSLTELISPFEWQFFSDETRVIDYIDSNREEFSTTVLLVVSNTFGERILSQIHDVDQLEAVIVYCTEAARHTEWTQNYPKILNVLNEPQQLQFELVHFLVKYYKRLGALMNDRRMAKKYFKKALDILRQYGKNSVETSQLIIEFETTYMSGQYQKTRHIDFEKLSSNKEDITVVWFDHNMNARSEHVQKLLKKLNDKVFMYNNSYKCIQDLKNRDDKVFLIISGVMAELYLTDFHLLSQVDAIFIFCVNRYKYQELFQNKSNYKKLVGCFTNEQDLIEAVHRMSHLKTYVNFSLLDANVASQSRLTKKSAIFIWNQLLLTALCEVKVDKKTAKSELLDYCRNYYSDNKTELYNIEEFNDNYEDVKAIVWYTKNSFIHKLLNKALRTYDHARLLTFQFYIKDLRQQLYDAYDCMREKGENKLLTVYRGQMMHTSELQELKNNIGNLISMNGFLSTTREYNVACIYAGLGTTESWTPDYQSCLLQIEVDYEHGDTIFADISDSSLYPEEKEVLFMAGSTFRISAIGYNENKNLWEISLRDVPGTKCIVNQYFTIAKTELKQSNNTLLFAKLMYYLGEFSKFDVYFKAISNTLSEEQTDIMQLLFQTALACEKEGKTIDALNNYTQLLDKQLNNPSIASTYSSIGQLHLEMKNYSVALSNYAKALEIQSKCFPIEHPVLMQTLKRITQIGYNIEEVYSIKPTKFDENYLQQEGWDTLDDAFMDVEQNSITSLSSTLSDEDSISEETVIKSASLIYLIDFDDEIELIHQFSEKSVVYTNPKECLEKIHFMSDSVIFLVILSLFDESIISLLQALPQIHSIYISTFTMAENLQKAYNKVRFVCNDNQKNLITRQLKKDLAKYYREKGDQYNIENNPTFAQFYYKKALDYF